MKALWLGLLLLLPAAGPSHAQGEIETRVATESSGKLRMLFQRASRQYVMFQYGVGNLAITKQPLLETVEEIGLILRRLQSPDTPAGSAASASPEVNSQLKLVVEKWDRLYKIYTYQPYKLFQAKELLPPAVRKQDPVLVRYVDRLTRELLAEADLLGDAYVRYCESTGSTRCGGRVREIGTQMLLVESVTNNLLFAVLDIDQAERRKRLRERTEELEASLAAAGTPGYYGENPSMLIPPVLETISAYWQQMKTLVDLGLKGDQDEFDIDQLLRSQQRLIEEILHLTSLLTGR